MLKASPFFFFLIFNILDLYIPSVPAAPSVEPGSDNNHVAAVVGSIANLV